jgi:xanthine/CO dehydrogenase XdhC/CoxF family maturation factor
MNELHEVIAALEGTAGARGAAVLATLVRVEGSAYSGPGARMAVLPDASIAGTFGAGCFEQDLVGHAERIRAAGAPALVRYDLTVDDDKPWGLGMGCHGKLDLLLEPVPPGQVPEHLAFLQEAGRARQRAAVATLFGTGGDAALGLGHRLLVREHGETAGALLGSKVGAALLAEARAALADGRARFFRAPGPQGDIEALIEVVAPPIALVVAGAGRDTVPLVRIGQELGWDVRTLGKDDLPQALDERCAAVVMSHNYERDVALLAALLASPCRYVGVLGGQVRVTRLLDELKRHGTPVTPAQRARLHAPVGLDLGAETPSEVALSIAAEIQAVFADRRGGALSERKGPIHDRP